MMLELKLFELNWIYSRITKRNSDTKDCPVKGLKYEKNKKIQEISKLDKLSKGRYEYEKTYLMELLS